MNVSRIAWCNRMNRWSVGFTLLEVLLVVSLSCLLCIGFLSFILDGVKLYQHLSARSEVIHQLLTGLEAICGDLQKANPVSIQLMGNIGEGGYSQLQFTEYNSADLHWFYLNPEGKLIRAIQRPNEDWGRNSVAEGVEGLSFSKLGTAVGSSLLRLEVRGNRGGLPIVFSTKIAPGFQ